MLEKQIERKVSTYANLKNVFNVKFCSMSYRSLPDRVFITSKGKLFFIEFKAKGKKPTKLQQLTIDRLKSINCRVHIVDDVEQGKKIVDEYVKAS